MASIYGKDSSWIFTRQKCVLGIHWHPEFIHTLIKPVNERIGAAVRQTGADEKLVQFTWIYTRKISDLLDEQADTLPPGMIKNKILRNFFDRLRPRYGDPLIDRVQTFLKAVKLQVKADFPLQYFYRASEVIEEARPLRTPGAHGLIGDFQLEAEANRSEITPRGSLPAPGPLAGLHETGRAFFHRP